MKITLVLLSLFLATAVFSAEEAAPVEPKMGYLAITGGWVKNYAGNNENGGVMMGRVGLMLGDLGFARLAPGFVLSYAYTRGPLLGSDTGALHTRLMVEFLLKEIGQTGLYAGGRFGYSLGLSSVNNGLVNETGTGFAFVGGPAFGYEFKFGRAESPLHFAFLLDIGYMSRGDGTYNFSNNVASRTYPGSRFWELQAGIAIFW